MVRKKIDKFPEIKDEDLLGCIHINAYKIYQNIVSEYPLKDNPFNKNVTFATLQLALTFYIANHVMSDKFSMAIQVVVGTINDNLEALLNNHGDIYVLC